MSVAATENLTRHDVSSSWLRFPVNLLVTSYGLRKWAPKLVWLVIPLEYYVITRFAGGVSADSYLSAIIFSVVCVLAFLITGFAAASVWRFESDLRIRSRGMVIALLVVWGTALLLLASSYFLTYLCGGGTRDLLANLVYDRWPSEVSPHQPSIQNFIAHMGYAFLAAIIDSLVIRGAVRLNPPGGSIGSKRHPPAEWIYEPNIILIILLVALLMMLLHALTIAQFTSWLSFS